VEQATPCANRCLLPELLAARVGDASAGAVLGLERISSGEGEEDYGDLLRFTPLHRHSGAMQRVTPTKTF
jgi:hypothetical protein